MNKNKEPKRLSIQYPKTVKNENLLRIFLSKQKAK